MDTPQTITTLNVYKFRLSHVVGPAHAKIGPAPGPAVSRWMRWQHPSVQRTLRIVRGLEE